MGPPDRGGGGREAGDGGDGPPAGGSGGTGGSAEPGSSAGSGSGARGPGRRDRQPDSRRAAIWLAATFVGAVGIAVGNDLTTVFAHSPAIFIVVLAAVTITIGALYFATDMRERLRPAGSGEIDASQNGAAGQEPRAIQGGAVRAGSGEASGTALGGEAGSRTGGGPGARSAGTGGEAGSRTGGDPGAGAGGRPGPGRGGGREEAGAGAGDGGSRAGATTAGGRREGQGGGEDEPSTAVRWWLIVSGVALAMGAAFAVGFWVIGNGFAHGLALGLWAVASVAAGLGAAVTLARRRHGAPGWLAWLGAWRNGVLAIGVSAIGLSSGATLGYAQLRPAAAPPVPCPPPTELRVLAASEVLGPLQAAITAYEQDERARFATSCYAVDITAYAAGNDKAAVDGIISGWNLANGPRPDIWIPASSEELPIKTSPADNPQVGLLGSVASSPVVIAVPSRLVTPGLRQYESDHSLPDIYGAIKGGFTLQVPNPRLSETARLGLADLHPAFSRADQARIGDSVSFPTDSGSLLCQSAPAKATAYLVSAVTVAASNRGDLGAAACPAQQAAQPPLTAFTPANGNGVALDFPYTTVTWQGAPASKAKAAAQQDFFRWLLGPAGQRALTRQGLNPPGLQASLPSADAIAAAVNGFTSAQPSARILVAIDDSAPMRPYLGQVAQAVDALLGPNGQGGNLSSRDSFGIWAFPGPGNATDQAAVPLATQSAAQRARVPGAVAALAAHGHSAEFDMVYDAAIALSGQAPPESASSLVLLTDGDNQRTDAGGDDMAKITDLLNALKPGGLPVKVYVIAFGPAGCAETPSGLSGDSLNALARAGGGACADASSGSLQQQLAQDLSALSTGG